MNWYFDSVLRWKLFTMTNKDYISRVYIGLWRPIYAPIFTVSLLATWLLQNTKVRANLQQKYCFLFTVFVLCIHIEME